MSRLDFGDLYRFIVSLGVAVVVGSVGSVWLFLKEPFDLTLTAADLESLAPVAQQLVARKLRLVDLTLSALPWAAGFGALLGFGLIAYGIKRWVPLQHRRDETEHFEGEKVRWEVHEMSRQERADQVRAEVTMDRATALVEQEALSSGSLEAAVEDYLATEDSLLTALSDSVPEDVQILLHQRIGVHSFDAVLRRRVDGTEYLIEIKRVGAESSARALRDAIDSLCHAVNWLSFMKQGEPTRYPVLLVSVTSGLEHLFNAALEWEVKTRDSGGAHGRSLIRFVQDDSLTSFSAKQLGKLLDPKQRVAIISER